MKKIFKIAFPLLLAVILMASALSFNISAASATTHFSPSKNDFSVGEEITVTIKFDAGTEVYSIEGDLSYDNTVVQYVSGGGADKGKSVKIAEALSGETKVDISVKFKTIAEGKCTFSFSGFCTDINLTPHNASTGYFINVKNPTQSEPTPPPPGPSDNANLASLKVSGATLSPKFNSNTTSYTATVPFGTDKVTITAGVADAGATLVGAGTINLNVGDNRRTITVTAASGAKKSYNLVIKRLAEEQGEPTPPSDDTDPLIISAEGTNRKIMQDISSMPVPESFSAATTEVNGVQVGALTEAGGKYTLVYTTLEDGSDAALFYQDDEGVYRRLLYIDVNGKFYIITETPSGYAPDGWYKDTMSITGGRAPAFRSEDPSLKDFYVLYCYLDGEYGFYRFDSLKTTIQRAPDFKLGELQTNDVNPPVKQNIFGKFKDMNPTGKAVVVLIALAIVCIAALVVLLILRLTGATKNSGDGIFDSHDDEEAEDTGFEFTLEETKISENSDNEW